MKVKLNLIIGKEYNNNKINRILKYKFKKIKVMLTKVDKIKLSILSGVVLSVTILVVYNIFNTGIHPGV